MTGARSTLLGLFLLAVGACADDPPKALPPAGQLLVYFDTDAPLPPAAGEVLAPGEPAPLFDRLRVEVYRPGETAPCPGCTHEFDVDRALFAGGRASIGITPPVSVPGYVVRARLFRAAFVELGQPRTDATLETVAALPPIEAEGIVPVTVLLRTDDVARPVGSLGAPVEPLAGTPPGLVGTWSGAKRTPCNGAPAADEVCVPGGAFWMGNPLTRNLLAAGDDVVLRLVTLSPFFLDATEVTVPAFRAAGIAAAGDPMPYHPDDGMPGPRVHCTYRPSPGDSDALPVNCVSWGKAMEYCERRGATLPSEAQFQYVASGLAGHLYVWGDAPPSCDDAVFARANGLIDPDVKCPGAWVEPPGQGRRDRLVLPGGTIVDLGGNLSEHALDRWNLQTERCWGTGVFHDPVCATESGDPRTRASHTLLGGSFVSAGGFAAAASRHPAIRFPDMEQAGPAGGWSAPSITSTGFRCARPDP